MKEDIVSSFILKIFILYLILWGCIHGGWRLWEHCASIFKLHRLTLKQFEVVAGFIGGISLASSFVFANIWG